MSTGHKVKLNRPLRIAALALAAAVVAALAGALLVRWKAVTDSGGQQVADPFRIAGNLYYVGANDVTSFLLTGPEGHVLIDGGYPDTAAMIIDSIAKLGFDIADVRILLNTHAHFDHAGGLAVLQEASGAELWVSRAEAGMIEAGGDDPAFGPMRLTVWSGLARYRAPRVDHRFEDGEAIQLGPIELTAHVTPGHTPGCTSWSFPVRAGDRDLDVVLICAQLKPIGFDRFRPSSRAEMIADFEHSFETLRSLPADIFLTTHAREFGRWRKYQESLVAEDPVEPFIDPEGYRQYVDDAEARLRAMLDN